MKFTLYCTDPDSAQRLAEAINECASNLMATADSDPDVYGAFAVNVETI